MNRYKLWLINTNYYLLQFLKREFTRPRRCFNIPSWHDLCWLSSILYPPDTKDTPLIRRRTIAPLENAKSLVTKLFSGYEVIYRFVRCEFWLSPDLSQTQNEALDQWSSDRISANKRSGSSNRCWPERDTFIWSEQVYEMVALSWQYYFCDSVTFAVGCRHMWHLCFLCHYVALAGGIECLHGSSN